MQLPFMLKTPISWALLRNFSCSNFFALWATNISVVGSRPNESLDIVVASPFFSFFLSDALDDFAKSPKCCRNCNVNALALANASAFALSIHHQR
jgi:hypothetical protein